MNSVDTVFSNRKISITIQHTTQHTLWNVNDRLFKTHFLCYKLNIVAYHTTAINGSTRYTGQWKQTLSVCVSCFSAYVWQNRCHACMHTFVRPTCCCYCLHEHYDEQYQKSNENKLHLPNGSVIGNWVFTRVLCDIGNVSNVSTL